MGWQDDFIVAYGANPDGSDYAMLCSYGGNDENVVIPEDVHYCEFEWYNGVDAPEMY